MPGRHTLLGDELCRNRTGLRFSVRSFGCALFYYILIEIRIFRKRAILMALIKCPDCGKNVSNRAPACIYCGCPLDKDNNDTVSGFSVVSLDGNTVSLQCEKCKKTFDYLRSAVLVSVSEQEWITHTTIRCPSCGNTMGQGLKIKLEYIKSTNLKGKARGDEQYEQIASKQGKVKIALLFVILLVGFVVWMFASPKTIESGNGYKHQVGSFGECEVNFDDCMQDATHRIHHFFGNEDYCDACWESYGQGMFEKLADGSDSSGRKCSACGKIYKDGSDNANSIARTSMCTNCYENYKWKKDVIDELPIG